MTQLRITEIFHSLQGETARAGLPTIFVRLTGCPLRCRWCDTAYAFSGGKLTELDDVLQEISNLNCSRITVTGGEPLAQPACLELLRALCDAAYEVSLETSGALDTSKVDPRVAVVLDLKAPASGEAHRNDYRNLERLRPHDAVKFVLADRSDYDWARFKLQQWQLQTRCEVLFSPVANTLAPKDLAHWILEDRLPVRFQMQLHKQVWGDEPGR